MKIEYDMKTVANNLKRAMKNKGVSVQEIANLTNFSESAVRNILNGNTRASLTLLTGICNIVDLTLDEIMGIKDNHITQVSDPHWETDAEGILYCSYCRNDAPGNKKSRFCPNCGEEMQDREIEPESAACEDQPEKVEWTPPTVRKTLVYLKCRTCGSRFAKMEDQNSTSEVCGKCNSNIPLNENMALAAYDCPGCGKHIFFYTNITAPSFVFRCKCGTRSLLRFDYSDKSYKL